MITFYAYVQCRAKDERQISEKFWEGAVGPAAEILSQHQTQMAFVKGGEDVLPDEGCAYVHAL